LRPALLLRCSGFVSVTASMPARKILPGHDLLDRLQWIALGADCLQPALNIEKALLPMPRSLHPPMTACGHRQIRAELARGIIPGPLNTVRLKPAPNRFTTGAYLVCDWFSGGSLPVVSAARNAALCAGPRKARIPSPTIMLSLNMAVDSGPW
jgi:hypothetical protein